MRQVTHSIERDIRSYDFLRFSLWLFMSVAIQVPNVVLIVDRANLSHVRTSYIDVFRQYLRDSMSVDRDILFGGVESIQIHFAIFSLPLLFLLFSDA